MKAKRQLAVTTALGVVCIAMPAFAQAENGAAGQIASPAEAAQVPPSQAPADSGGVAGATTGVQASSSGLQDIIVTAQRRSENLQRAAIAITAVPADALVRAGVTDTTQLTRVAPAIQIGTIGGTLTAFYLRGVGNFTANSLSDAAVSVNLDGVPIARSNAIQGMFFDLERVEVLKGPQGTLYGRNATGGAVNLLTAKPRAGELSGYINGEYGNYDAKKVQAAINIPAGEKGAFRVAGLFSDRNGYYSDGTGDEKMRAIRVQGASQLTDTLKVTAGGDFSFVGGIGAGATVVGLDKDRLIGLTDPRAQALYSAAYSPAAGAFLSPLKGGTQFQHNKYWGMFAQVDWQTDIGTFTILPSYRDADIKYRDYAGSFSNNDQLKDQQTSVEVRLASDSSSRLGYLFGGFFMQEKFTDIANYFQFFQNFYNPFSGDTKSYAGFGRLTYKITDRLRISGGARYTIDKKSANLDSVNGIVVCGPAQFGGNCIGTPTLPDTGFSPIPPSFIADANRNPVRTPPCAIPIPGSVNYGNGACLLTAHQVINPSKTFKKFTYRAGVEYDLGPQSLLYASYETGFKSGGFFISDFNPVYDPETIDAITIGSKNRFLDNKLQLNIEGFWWNYKDQQVSHFRLAPNAANPAVPLTEFATENIGKTRVRGIEVEALARVAELTTLSFTVQLNDAKYRDFKYSNPTSFGPPLTGCPFTTGVSGNTPVYIIDCGGRRAINAPKWTLSGGIEQGFDIADGRLTFNVDGRYETASYKGFEQIEQERQKAYFVGNLQAQYAFAGSHLTIGGFVNNFTNTKVISFATPSIATGILPNGTYLTTAAIRPPRFYGVRAGYKF